MGVPALVRRAGQTLEREKILRMFLTMEQAVLGLRHLRFSSGSVVSRGPSGASDSQGGGLQHGPIIEAADQQLVMPICKTLL